MKIDVEPEIVEPGTAVQIGGARVEVLGGRHAVIHPDIPVIPNNASLVDGTHLHPGDALTVVPAEPLEVLFLPTAAPWQKLSDARAAFLPSARWRRARRCRSTGDPLRAGHVLRPLRAARPGETRCRSSTPATPSRGL